MGYYSGGWGMRNNMSASKQRVVYEPSRKITIDNVELHVYHTGMGYLVYNETYAVLVTHIREVRQYDIQGGGV